MIEQFKIREYRINHLPECTKLINNERLQKRLEDENLEKRIFNLKNSSDNNSPSLSEFF